MKKRNKKNILDINFISDTLFVLSGLAVMIIFMIISALIMSGISLSYKITVIIAETSLCAGCFISGFFYALFKRKNGLFNGMINAIKIYLVIFITGLIFMDKISPELIPLRFAGAVISGMLGGIYGVNSKFKKPI